MKKASILLKISGVLMMIGSIVHFLFGLTFLHFFSTSLTMGAVSGDKLPLLMAVLFMSAFSSLVILISGIIAIINSTEPLKGAQTAGWAAAALFFGTLSGVLVMLLGYESSIFFNITGVDLPLVHVVISMVFYVMARKGYRLYGKRRTGGSRP